MPYRGCGLRNQSGSTPSSDTRFSTPLEPTIAVLTAPGQDQEADDDDQGVEDQPAPSCGPMTFIARPPIRLSL